MFVHLLELYYIWLYSQFIFSVNQRHWVLTATRPLRWTKRPRTRWVASRAATSKTGKLYWTTSWRWCVTSSQRSTPITALLDKPTHLSIIFRRNTEAKTAIVQPYRCSSHTYEFIYRYNRWLLIQLLFVYYIYKIHNVLVSLQFSQISDVLLFLPAVALDELYLYLYCLMVMAVLQWFSACCCLYIV